ncbi:hypothetical protein DERP_007052 [Dermatophagoides pteronyssinus]|uniref:Uncharacterized protein n=1 Tax=Dermatophagoides pteronyssinus TaxID=6956 RepID=A0ABQ8JU84_DERPT|nr:hypothetical protein DERP_007052 [Dermatophagoides pteronyssinus]
MSETMNQYEPNDEEMEFGEYEIVDEETEEQPFESENNLQGLFTFEFLLLLKIIFTVFICWSPQFLYVIKWIVLTVITVMISHFIKFFLFYLIHFYTNYSPWLFGI